MNLKARLKSNSFCILLNNIAGGLLFSVLFYYTVLLIIGIRIPFPILAIGTLLWVAIFAIFFKRETLMMQKISKITHPKYGFAGWQHILKEFKKAFPFGFVFGMVYGLYFSISHISPIVTSLLLTALSTLLTIIVYGIIFGILFGVFFALGDVIKVTKKK